MPRPRVKTVALAGAVLWGAALVVLACTAPAYRSTSITASLPPTEPALPAPVPSSVTGAAPAPIPAPPLTVPTVTTETSATLVEVNGPGVLLVAGAPLAVAITVGLLLRVKGSAGRVTRVIAWGLTGFVALLAMLGALTIGPLILPVAFALFIACAAGDAPRPTVEPATTIR